jgi:hypothetical protein
MSSSDGGKTWRKISPDLSFPKDYVPPKPEKKQPEKKDAKKPAAKPSATKNAVHDEDQNDDEQFVNAKDAMEHAQEMMEEDGQRRSGGSSISTLSPSALDNGIIWAGMGNGTIKLTRDHGRSWDDVNIPDSKRAVGCIDASHTDPASAYVTIASDTEPLVYKTKDFGKTWKKIVNGLPTDEVTGSSAHVIRADTKKDGLLFLGTESSVYVSFDDGNRWQSLRLNSPNTSYTDMLIKDNDLVVGTYGRSFWILDDISPLRQATQPMGSAYLFAPGEAVRVRRNVSQDTPMPPEVPHSLNAPPGALIYYFLGKKPSSDITLDVTDSHGKQVRHYSSAPYKVEEDDFQPLPDFWKEPAHPMSTDAGTNRMNWDLRYENPPAFSHGYDISATPNLTPTSPQGPLVLPGVYTLTLTVDGQKYTQQITVVNDPRSPGSPRDLREQHELQMDLYESDVKAVAGMKALGDLRTKLSALDTAKLSKEANAALDALNTKLEGFGRGAGRRGGFAFGFSAPDKATFDSIQGATILYLSRMEFGDIGPSQPIRNAVLGMVKDMEGLEKAWKEIHEKDLKALNALLAKSGIAAIQ